MWREFWRGFIDELRPFSASKLGSDTADFLKVVLVTLLLALGAIGTLALGVWVMEAIRVGGGC